ncbi:MAG: hypothetical protein GY865_02990 [candidate division Zixibacteria bacterium]|nr:hypothetical protein [candidate division Zixibacteria bacterium]
MLNCHELQFSSRHSQNRMERARSILGIRLLNLIIGLALYLLGAKRSVIAMSLEVPDDTLKSFFKRVFKIGFSAFEDRRRKSPPPPASLKTIQSGAASVKIDDNEVAISFGSSCQPLKIPIQNKLQIKTILLTCLDNKLLKNAQTADIIGYSSRHTLKLSGDLKIGDVYSLLDKRQGQRQDYLVTPEVKAELIQQFVVALLSKEPPTGKQIAEALKERCEINMADRTVRYHISKLGLSRIKKSLPKILAELKKNSYP